MEEVVAGTSIQRSRISTSREVHLNTLNIAITSHLLTRPNNKLSRVLVSARLNLLDANSISKHRGVATSSETWSQ